MKKWQSLASQGPFAPGACAREVECCQPWISGVFDLVSDCLPSFLPVGIDDKKRNTPIKNRQTHEVILSGNSCRHERKFDLMLGKDAPYEKKIVDDAIKLAVEQKPETRKQESPKSVHTGGVDQGLATAAKSVMISFNFAKVGLPSRATHIAVTPAFIQVYQLQVMNIGTPEVKAVWYASKRYPFFTFKTYEKFIASAGAKNLRKFDEEREDMYGREGKGGMDGVGRPLGYKVVAVLMSVSEVDLYGPTVVAEHDILGPILGYGTYSMVFRHEKNRNRVVKLSRFGRDIGDKEILKSLKSLQEKPKTIVTLVESSSLCVAFGDVRWQLPILIMEPRGRQLLDARRDTNCSSGKWIMKVQTDIVSALDFIHLHGILHRDVKPSNIIVVDDAAEAHNFRAVLIDFSISCKLDAQEVGFCGTRNYTHREVYKFFPNLKYRGRKEFDLASLGFTLAVVANEGILPWRSIVEFPCSLSKENMTAQLDARMENRFHMAMAAADNVGENAASSIKELLLMDQK